MDQAVLKLKLREDLPPECWDYRPVSLLLANSGFLSNSFAFSHLLEAGEAGILRGKQIVSVRVNDILM